MPQLPNFGRMTTSTHGTIKRTGTACIKIPIKILLNLDGWL